jgi:endonuclease/exonuclease/phosphatase family metal-dependent hydrolase
MNILRNKLLSNTLLSATVILLLSACSDSNNNNNKNKINAITVTSYNMGLALNFVPYTQERLVANEALIADYDSDVICMQEVWLEEHVDAIEQALGADYPYIYTVEPEQVFSETAACTNEEIAGFADCAETQCPGFSGNDLVDCGLAQCGAFLGDLSPSCVDGLFGAVGIPDITIELLVETVTQPVGKFAFDGSLGLILASKYELLAREFQDFIDDSSGNHRGALYAEIEVNKETHVLGCTHPTANLSATIDYPESGKYGSWEGENRFMQEQMIAFVNDKAGDKPIFFGGDFNCSIANASNGVDADFPDNCQLWLTDGFTDPAADQLPCTFCEDENLVLQGGQGEQKEEGSENTLLDHVFVKNLETSDAIVAERVFDDPVSIEALVPPSELEPEDSPMLTHPSDHFGVELDIPLP